MSGHPHVLGVLLATVFAATATAAEPSWIRPGTATSAAAPIPPSPRRAISASVAGLLAAAAPPYVAPATNNPAPTSNPSLPPAPLAEVDSPRNGIIRLPGYIVREDRAPALKPRELLTARGRVDLAFKLHPGLRLGSFGWLNNNRWADALLEEDLGIERQKEMFDLLGGPSDRRPILTGRPPFWLPAPASGPWKGMVVPWERK